MPVRRALLRAGRRRCLRAVRVGRVGAVHGRGGLCQQVGGGALASPEEGADHGRRVEAPPPLAIHLALVLEPLPLLLLAPRMLVPQLLLGRVHVGPALLLAAPRLLAATPLLAPLRRHPAAPLLSRRLPRRRLLQAVEELPRLLLLLARLPKPAPSHAVDRPHAPLLLPAAQPARIPHPQGTNPIPIPNPNPNPTPNPTPNPSPNPNPNQGTSAPRRSSRMTARYEATSDPIAKHFVFALDAARHQP